MHDAATNIHDDDVTPKKKGKNARGFTTSRAKSRTVVAAAPLRRYIPGALTAWHLRRAPCECVCCGTGSPLLLRLRRRAALHLMLSSAAAATTGFPRNDTVGVSHDDAQRAPGSPRCCDGAGACCHRRRHFGQTPKNLRQTNEWSEARARGRCSAVRDVARSRGNPAQPSPGRVRESRGGGSSPWHGEAGPGSSCEARPLGQTPDALGTHGKPRGHRQDFRRHACLDYARKECHRK